MAWKYLTLSKTFIENRSLTQTFSPAFHLFFLLLFYLRGRFQSFIKSIETSRIVIKRTLKFQDEVKLV